jgi:hypothetical protein
MAATQRQRQLPVRFHGGTALFDWIRESEELIIRFEWPKENVMNLF